jgi:hypothetical protein
MNFRFRKPRLRVNKKGKISLSGGGMSIGNKNARLNISKSGVSGTVGAKGKSYNTKRGWNCGFIALMFIGSALAGIAGAVNLLI